MLPLEIQNVKFFKQFAIVKFKGIDNINDIEKYRGKSLYVSTVRMRWILTRTSTYIADLIGMKVCTEDGSEFGTLKDVMETGANEVYIIDSLEHGEVLIPAIRECILDVDMDEERMTIHLMEGLVVMNIHIMTLFPEMVMGGLNTSITGRAISKGILSIEAVNIRDYAFNKHNSVDDYPYGGGAGMLMQAEPVYQCYQAIVDKIHTQGGADSELCAEKKKPRVLYMSPQGQTFTQGMAEELAQEEELIFLCGHYEGIDERVLDEIVTDYVSIGDYVLTGGELPAMVMVDADVQDGAGCACIMMYLLNSRVFQDNLLEYPQYSRPEDLA